MTNINEFASKPENKKLIDKIIGDENTGKALPYFNYITNNNLTRMGPFPTATLSHHLFVAELAHEIVD